ncbi:MAG: acyloxyacyl hydrolase [Pseudomonadota bacterium]
MTGFRKALALIALLAASGVEAQEITLGLGTTDYGEQGSDGAAFALEHKHRPFRQKRVMSLSFGAAATVSAEGDVFLGGGLWTRWEWPSGWFVDNSVMPGLYEEGTAGNDLGSTLQIRSLLGVGYRFDNGGALSVALTHKSNAGLADDNPGANAYLLRYHFSF